MGFHAKAEYTLELIKEPRAHELIDQRFVCYGFILSSSTDEYALQTLIENWQEIDRITSDRIRYLFFIENEITLTGYPNPPTFTQRGYERAHQRMLGLARQQNFTWKVNRQAEVRFDINGRPSGSWQPQHKVAQVAEQLGVGPMMPCLAWILEGERKYLFVRSLNGLAAPEILKEIKRFCDHFYRENVAVFTALAEIEGQIRDTCGSLTITLKELDELEGMARKRVELRKFIRNLEQLNPEPSKRTETTGTLSATVKGLTRLGPLPVSLQFKGVLKELPKWERALAKVEQCLQGDSDLKVPHLHSTYTYCITFDSKFPENAVKLRSSKQRANTGYLRKFVSCMSDAALADLEGEALAELAGRLRRARDYVEQNVDKIESESTPVSEQLLTQLNVFMLMRELGSAAGIAHAEHGDLVREMRDDLVSHFQEVTHCIALELHLWMYSELTNAHETLERRIKRTFTTSRFVHEDAFQSKDIIRDLIKIADDKCKRIQCSILDEYKKVKLPKLAASPVGELLSITNDPEKVADSRASGYFSSGNFQAFLHICCDTGVSFW